MALRGLLSWLRGTYRIKRRGTRALVCPHGEEAMGHMLILSHRTLPDAPGLRVKAGGWSDGAAPPVRPPPPKAQRPGVLCAGQSEAAGCLDRFAGVSF